MSAAQTTKSRKSGRTKVSTESLVATGLMARMLAQWGLAAAVTMAAGAIGAGDAAGNEFVQLSKAADAALQQGDYSAAVRNFRAAVELCPFASISYEAHALARIARQRGLGTIGPLTPEPTAKPCVQLAWRHVRVAVFAASEDYLQAAEQLEKTIASAQKQLETDGADKEAVAVSLRPSHNFLAFLFFATGRDKPASKIFAETAPYWRKMVRPDPIDAATAQINRAFVSAHEGRRSEATTPFKEGLAVYEAHGLPTAKVKAAFAKIGRWGCSH